MSRACSQQSKLMHGQPVMVYNYRRTLSSKDAAPLSNEPIEPTSAPTEVKVLTMLSIKYCGAANIAIFKMITSAVFAAAARSLASSVHWRQYSPSL